jgi:hypothetical protein
MTTALKQVNNLQRKNKVHLITSMIVTERYSLFGEVRRGVSLLAPILKQSFVNSVWMERRTKKNPQCPRHVTPMWEVLIIMTGW